MPAAIRNWMLLWNCCSANCLKNFMILSETFSENGEYYVL